MHDFGDPDTPLAGVAEPLDGPFVQALAKLAGDIEATLVAGMFETAGDGLVYNTLVALGRDGDLAGHYRKIHLYDAFGYRESDRIAGGTDDPVLLTVGEHRVGLMTCYDLRFPELSRTLATQGADVLAIPAAWVRGPLKEDHWRTLLKARAIENTCYVAAAAQNGSAYCGQSMLVDPLGVVVSALGEQTGHCTGEVESDRIKDVRRRNPTLAHRRFGVVRRPVGVEGPS